jgi:NADH-quinone oxidoreductase subunit J
MNNDYIVFFVLAFLSVFTAVMVIIKKNPIASVVFLVLNFFIIACIYITLGAQFLAAIQVLVYAGAIMVLFVFVIMLLNLDEKIEYELINKKETFRIFLLSTAIVLIMYLLSFQNIFRNVEMYQNTDHSIGTVEEMSIQLFTRYLLPFEITSILLLSAIIGAVVLAKKRFP